MVGADIIDISDKLIDKALETAQTDLVLAKDIIDRAIEQYPGNPEAWVAKAEIDKAQGIHDKVIESYQKARSLTEHQGYIDLLISEFYVDKGNFTEALYTLDESEKDMTYRHHLIRARANIGRDNYNSALEDIGLGLNLVKETDTKKDNKISDYPTDEDIIVKDPVYIMADLLFDKAICQHMLGRDDRATWTFKKAKEINPGEYKDFFYGFSNDIEMDAKYTQRDTKLVETKYKAVLESTSICNRPYLQNIPLIKRIIKSRETTEHLKTTYANNTSSPRIHALPN